MKEKTGCPPRASFYIVVVVFAILGFVLGGTISNNFGAKIIGAIVLGFIGAVLAIDDTCFDDKGNMIMIPKIDIPPNTEQSNGGNK